MDAVVESGWNPVSKHLIQPVWRMSRLPRYGTAELVLQDRFLRRERGQGKKHFLKAFFSVYSVLFCFFQNSEH